MLCSEYIKLSITTASAFLRKKKRYEKKNSDKANNSWHSSFFFLLLYGRGVSTHEDRPRLSFNKISYNNETPRQFFLREKLRANSTKQTIRRVPTREVAYARVRTYRPRATRTSSNRFLVSLRGLATLGRLFDGQCKHRSCGSSDVYAQEKARIHSCCH